MSAALERLLRLQRGDLPRGLLLFVHLFLVICAFLVGQVARDALFLGRFPASLLPFADISLFVVVTASVALYVRAGRRLPLERLAESLGVTPLLQFFSADENSMCLLLEQGAGDPAWARHLPEPQWFEPKDGLVTIKALMEFLSSTPVSFGSETLPVLSELREYERVLQKAAKYKVRWHLAVSWR